MRSEYFDYASYRFRTRRTRGPRAACRLAISQTDGTSETESERDSGIISGSLCQQERPWFSTDPTPRSSSVFVYVRQPTPSYCCPQIHVLSG